MAGLLLAGAAACDDGPREPLATVGYVDLARYAGQWYEIAKIPNRFQRQCVADTTARYALRDDGRIDVVNRCRTGTGGFEEARGVARVVDAGSNARLEVSFFSILGWRPVWGDYWVLLLDPGYAYAVVGEPRRRYGWILSRTPALPEADRRLADQRLRELGYAPGKFEQSPQADSR